MKESRHSQNMFAKTCYKVLRTRVYRSTRPDSVTPAVSAGAFQVSISPHDTTVVVEDALRSMGRQSVYYVYTENNAGAGAILAKETRRQFGGIAC